MDTKAELAPPDECALCLQERELCDSHVIPEFFYRPAYDDEHKLLKLELEPYSKRFRFQGYYEPLLCRDCEDWLNQEYENPFKEAWYDGGLQPQPPLQRLTVLESIDYGTFKLLHLSILWRASVARRRFWRNVDLGAEDEESLRQMINEGRPGPPEDFPIGCQAVLFRGSIADGIIAEPGSVDYGWARLHHLMYGGCLWTFVTGEELAPGVLERALDSDGTLLVVRQHLFDDGLADRDFKDFFRSHDAG